MRLKNRKEYEGKGKGSYMWLDGTKWKVMSCAGKNEWYPQGFREITNSPGTIHAVGNLSMVNRSKNIAVVGSRKVSEKGIELARMAGRVIAEEGYHLVNGLALGCDTEAIKGALQANGKCIGILPCGLDQILPESNLELAIEILEKGGCLISEYPFGTEVKKYHYVERDRLQSAMSQCVLVVEAGIKSGTMYTAKYALQQHRRLACFINEGLENMEGNSFLVNNKKAKALHGGEDELRVFFSEGEGGSRFYQMDLGEFLS